MEDWIIEEIADTLRQARVSFLGITALDSSHEIQRKERENETAIVRRIDKCLKLIQNRP
jgi:hypothetical protein